MNLNNFWGGDCIEQSETAKVNERKRDKVLGRVSLHTSCLMVLDLSG